MANTTSTTPTSDNAFLHRKRVLGDESLEQLTPTLMGLPVEIRQQILSLVRDALYPWDQVILNPSSRHAVGGPNLRIKGTKQLTCDESPLGPRCSAHPATVQHQPNNPSGDGVRG